ncbi:hypothetical protein DESC_730055 [Desulfosarcina cetonica]|nr:hypothetical protein DESC_730055 [Desulfosarcina cetonica]
MSRYFSISMILKRAAGLKRLSSSRMMDVCARQGSHQEAPRSTRVTPRATDCLNLRSKLWSVAMLLLHQEGCCRRICGSCGQPDGQHRHRTGVDHIPGHAAEHQVVEFGMAMGSHDDQVVVAALCGVDNLLRRIADLDNDFLGRQGAFGDFLDHVAGGFADALVDFFNGRFNGRTIQIVGIRVSVAALDGDAGFRGVQVGLVRHHMQHLHRGTELVANAAGVAHGMAGRFGKIGGVKDVAERGNHGQGTRSGRRHLGRGRCHGRFLRPGRRGSLTGLAEDTVGVFHIPGRRLNLDDIGHGHHQGRAGSLGAEGVDGDGQGDGEVAHDRTVDQGDGVVPWQQQLADHRADGEVEGIDNGQRRQQVKQQLGCAGDGLGLEGHGDEDNAQHAHRGQGWKTGCQAGLKGFLAILLHQYLLGGVAGEHGDKNDHHDLFHHRGDVNLQRGAHQGAHIKGGCQAAEGQADHGHLYGGFDVAFGESGPGDRHAAGGDQPGHQKPQGHVRLILEKDRAQAKGDEGNQAEIDQLGQDLGLGVTPLDYLLDLQGDHHGVDHEKGKGNDQLFQGRGIHQHAGDEAGEHHHRDGHDEVLVDLLQVFPHGLASLT